jgi:AP2 domain
MVYAARGAAAPSNKTLSEVDLAWLRGKSFEQVFSALQATGGAAFATGSSAFRGVSWDKRKGKWEAKIGIQGKRMKIGYFNSEKAAAHAYDAAARRILRGCVLLRPVAPCVLLYN